MRVTRIGGPTALIEWEGWRILTDPTFDPPGRVYSFGLGTSSRKTVGPALTLGEIGDVDLVLLSHHGHADNLDDGGRAALAQASTVLTTRAGASALTHPDVRGLEPGESAALTVEGRPALTVTATPGRHGAPLTRPVVGPVIGFSLTLDGTDRPGLWMTGDTVLYRTLRRAVEGLRPDVMLVHAGRVRFPLTGALRYTMDASQAAELIGIVDPRVVVPVHVEGWSHFSQQEAETARALAASPVADRIRWAPLGDEIEVP